MQDCEDKIGTRIWHSGYSQTLPAGEEYYAYMQVDGNFVVRKYSPPSSPGGYGLTSVWSTCSSQGSDVVEDFALALMETDTVAILDKDGNPIWESFKDEIC